MWELVGLEAAGRLPPAPQALGRSGQAILHSSASGGFLLGMHVCRCSRRACGVFYNAGGVTQSERPVAPPGPRTSTNATSDGGCRPISNTATALQRSPKATHIKLCSTHTSDQHANWHIPFRTCTRTPTLTHSNHTPTRPHAQNDRADGPSWQHVHEAVPVSTAAVALVPVIRFIYAVTPVLPAFSTLVAV